MEDFETILQMWRRFQDDPSEELAMKLEEKLDFLKLQIGYRFDSLCHICRIERNVARFLDKIENERRLNEFVESDIGEINGTLY